MQKNNHAGETLHFSRIFYAISQICPLLFTAAFNPSVEKLLQNLLCLHLLQSIRI